MTRSHIFGFGALVGWLLSASAIAQESQAAREEVPLDVLRAVSRVADRALDAIAPSIVRIETIGGAQPAKPRGDGQGGGRGPDFRQGDGPTTGVVWSADGFIVTSSFNFLRDPTVITVILHDDRRFVAKLISRDEPGRIALLKIEAGGLPVPQKIGIDGLHAGQWILAAGYGQGTNTPSPSIGILSAVGRMNGMAVQTDAKISPANYGGPLLDLQGRLIGINVPMGMTTDEIAGVEFYDSGIGFATRVDRIERNFARLSAGHDVQRGLLGVTLEPEDLKPAPATQTAQPRGMRIGGEPRGPAVTAGLKKGDLIIALNDHPTPRLVDLRRALWASSAGEAVKVRYMRDGQTFDTELTLVTAAEIGAPEPATSQPAESQPAESQPAGG